MTTLAYPSTAFPGRPRLELALPDGWEALPAVGAMTDVAFAAVRPLPEGEFRANVIVSVDEVGPGHNVTTDLDAVARTAAERRQGVVGPVHARVIGGVTFFGRDLSHVDQTAGTLLTSTHFGFLRREVDRALVRVTVTGTIGSARHVEDYAELQCVIDGLLVHPAPGTTPVVDGGR